jgi:hypothetical protein
MQQRIGATSSHEFYSSSYYYSDAAAAAPSSLTSSVWSPRGNCPLEPGVHEMFRGNKGRGRRRSSSILTIPKRASATATSLRGRSRANKGIGSSGKTRSKRSGGGKYEKAWGTARTSSSLSHKKNIAMHRSYLEIDLQRLTNRVRFRRPAHNQPPKL